MHEQPPSGGAYNNRNGPERTGMDQNAPEWASITGMDIKINLFYATKFIILPQFILKFQFLMLFYLFEVHMSTVSGFLHG